MHTTLGTALSYGNNMTKFDTEADFDAHCRAQESTIIRYVDKNHSGFQQLDNDTLGQLSPRETKYSYANNFGSRIRFTQDLLNEVERYVAEYKVKDIRFVTLTPAVFATTEGDATEFDVEAIKSWVRDHLPGHDYFGIVEAAYYPAWPDGRVTISWHVHLFAFEMTYRRFLEQKAAINASHHSLVPGVEAAVSESVAISNFTYKVRYMLKYPTYRYRPSQITVKAPPSSERATRIPTGRYYLNKDDLRPGELVRMCRILAHLGLDDLLFAAGSGEAIIAPVVHRATAAIRYDEDRRHF